MDLSGLEPLTSSLQMRRSSQMNYRPTAIRNFVKQNFLMAVGTPRLELGTSVLSGLCSNQLSYVPSSGYYIKKVEK